MALGRVLEGVFAIHKPTGISSAQVVRDLQEHFNHSTLFAPWIKAEARKREQEVPNQRNRRRQKKVEIKIGHGGTLDPMATGVLIAGVGKGTKKLQTFLECTKVYETVVLFGVSTDTYDREGRVLKRAPYLHITQEKVERALPQFRGKYSQLPPLYSAIKMNGIPLYEYARHGKAIPRKIEKRPVEVKELTMLEWLEGGTHEHKWPTEEAQELEKDAAEKQWEVDGKQEGHSKRKFQDNQDDFTKERPTSRRKASTSEKEAIISGTVQKLDPSIAVKERTSEALPEQADPPAVKFRMNVTSGFYVRSFCHDLGQAVDSQAIMVELVRSRQGQFELGKNVLEYSDLARGETVWGPKVEAMLDAWNEGEEKSGESESYEKAQVGKKSSAEELKVEDGEEFNGPGRKESEVAQS